MPNDCGSEVNGGKEVSSGLVVSSGDGAKLLEFGEEVLDQVAQFVEIAVVIPGVS